MTGGLKLSAIRLTAKVFKPLDKTVARRAFNLPAKSKLILFGAIGGTSDRRKGFAYLREALIGLDNIKDTELVIFGGEEPLALDLPLPVHQVGALQDELSLSLLYGACDVYVLPTLQEAYGNTLAEALASGTPCVTFDGSGAVDIVRHRQNGYAAKLRDAGDLLRGIEWTLAQSWSREELHSDISARYGSEQVASNISTSISRFWANQSERAPAHQLWHDRAQWRAFHALYAAGALPLRA